MHPQFTPVMPVPPVPPPPPSELRCVACDALQRFDRDSACGPCRRWAGAFVKLAVLSHNLGIDEALHRLNALHAAGLLR
jgi:hypothetical protein